ncbi:MAG: diacylglycerol kinase family protein [Planctomycetota bacterium]
MDVEREASPQPNVGPTHRWIPILANPKAGTGKRKNRLAELVHQLELRGFSPEVFHDRERFLLALEVPEALATCHCVVAAGGDGTIGWIINRLRDIPLAIFPTGSENLLARHFGIRRRPIAVAEMIADNQRHPLDIGIVNGHRFTLMATAGFDAHVVDLVHRERTGHVQRWHYATAIIRAFCFYRFPKMTIFVDDEPTGIVAYHALFANLPDYALRLSFHRNASGQDGRLDLILLERPGRFHVLRYLFALLTGRLHELPDVRHRSIEKARVEVAGPVAIQADGDPAGALPALFTIEPASLEVLVPKGFQEHPDH